MLSVIVLSVTYKPFVLIVVMLSVIRLNAVMLSVVVPKKALVAAANRCQSYKSFSYLSLLLRQNKLECLSFHNILGKRNTCC
jgi:hypothetical protein